MVTPQRLPASLTPLDVALAAILRGVEKVTPVVRWRRLHCIAAEMPLEGPSARAFASDGQALRANDLAGASSHSPLPLVKMPHWVEAAKRCPLVAIACRCRCGRSGWPITQVVTEAIPGQVSGAPATISPTEVL
jgi:hypothetical protein